MIKQIASKYGFVSARSGLETKELKTEKEVKEILTQLMGEIHRRGNACTFKRTVTVAVGAVRTIDTNDFSSLLYAYKIGLADGNLFPGHYLVSVNGVGLLVPHKESSDLFAAAYEAYKKPGDFQDLIGRYEKW
jgi:hypothetical protein